MKCLSKPAAFLIVSACLTLALIGSNPAQQVEARALRHDVYNSKHQRIGEMIARRERDGATKQQHVAATPPRAPASRKSSPTLVESLSDSILRALSAKILGNRSPAATSQLDINTSMMSMTEVKQALSSSKPSSRGRGLCIAGVCGLNLFFASIWITFVACFLVVFFLDRHLHSKNLTQHLEKESAKSEQKQKDAACSKKRGDAQKWIRAQISSYYQDVTDMSATMIRRRPLLGV